eukprot:gnl/MRDRNA2_/MRDRNA2_93137_c0_seq1.p1 gnl/MRDRNA2_/MRDRNA2_93137_c0~~gnl/MRDRNA2_/MRDRNA2_93137_c0_seq1.p1  ORF type:complete len:227 (+),score=62.14 gnl/MRDRNA2_/MRDRNA2_93137_c0_seq1:108-788(+)
MVVDSSKYAEVIDLTGGRGPIFQNPDGTLKAPKYYLREDLFKACKEGDYDLVEEILDPKQDYPKKRTLHPKHSLNDHVEANTPLHGAVIGGHTEVVELLLEKKADPHVRAIQTKKGKFPEDAKTALDYAKEEEFDDIVEILQKAERTIPKGLYYTEGVYANWRYADDKDGLTPKIEAKLAEKRKSGARKAADFPGLDSVPKPKPGDFAYDMYEGWSVPIPLPFEKA